MADKEEKPLFEMMLDGAFDEAEISDTIPEDNADNENTDENNNEDTEETEAETEEEVADAETNELNDEEADETEETTEEEIDEEDPENALVESDNESDADTKDQGDGADTDNAEPNYKEEYAKLLEESKVFKDYYEAGTSEFIANGKKVKGTKDPQKLIQSQQALYGLEEKFSALKKYKQFHAPLEKRGMITDQKKFDLVMNMWDGDKDAIKTHLKSLNIDPIYLDLDDVNYEGKTTTSSEIEINLNDIISASESAGIKADVEKVLYNDWDEDSVVDLLSTEGSRNMFLNHMAKDESGKSRFDVISEKAREMSVLSTDGFSDLNSIAKYNRAMQELASESNSGEQQTTPVVPSISQESIDAAKAANDKAIEDASAKAVADYKAKLEAKNKIADEGRKKATSASKKKTVKKVATKQSSDPMKLEGENFMDYFAGLQKVGL